MKVLQGLLLLAGSFVISAGVVLCIIAVVTNSWISIYFKDVDLTVNFGLWKECEATTDNCISTSRSGDINCELPGVLVTRSNLNYCSYVYMYF